MPTKSPRISITVDPATADLLAYLAKQKHISISSLAHTLVLEALEQHEDLALSQIAELRDRPGTKRSTHAKAWE